MSSYLTTAWMPACPSMTIRDLIKASLNLSRAFLGDSDRRDPRRRSPGHAGSRYLRIDEIGLALHRGLARPSQRRLELPRRFNHFSVDPEPLGDKRHVHVRIAQIVVDELARLD